MGAVLFTNEFPAAGISVFAELRYRNSVAGAIYEHDPDLIFPGSDAERAQALIACALYILYVIYYVRKNTFHKAFAYGMCFICFLY